MRLIAVARETKMCRFGLSLVVCLPLAAGNTYGKLPLSFEPNHGQTDARVKFLARASGCTLFVTPDEAVFAGRDGSVDARRSSRLCHLVVARATRTAGGRGCGP